MTPACPITAAQDALTLLRTGRAAWPSASGGAARADRGPAGRGAGCWLRGRLGCAPAGGGTQSDSRLRFGTAPSAAGAPEAHPPRLAPRRSGRPAKREQARAALRMDDDCSTGSQPARPRSRATTGAACARHWHERPYAFGLRGLLVAQPGCLGGRRSRRCRPGRSRLPISCASSSAACHEPHRSPTPRH